MRIPKPIAISNDVGTPWWWWEAQPLDLVAEAATMLVIGIILSFIVLALPCWAFALAVYVPPFLAGLLWALLSITGGGAIGALLLGLTIGVAILVRCTISLALRSPLIALPTALLFAVPAAVAGYHATVGLARIGVPAEAWREGLAVVGAIIVGATAWARA